MTALMSLALDGLADDKDRQRLEQHLDGCAACRAEWRTINQISALFERSEMVGPPLGFSVRVERRLAEQTKKRRRILGGLAVATSSMSLAGVTIGVVLLLVVGALAWSWLGTLPSVQQSTGAMSQFASSLGLVGKGASLFLGEWLLLFGPPLVVLLGIGLAVLLGIWTWLYLRRPGRSHHNGFA
jgi:predicted anti-sigma-YlaC factor YlaD